jgi:hypothetical protein
MQEKLKRIKELLEKSFVDSNKKDMYIGQAMGLIDSLLIDTTNNVNSTDLSIPNHVWKHVDKPTNQTMMNAVQRHKQVHEELSNNSITQKNTQFEQLK